MNSEQLIVKYFPEISEVQKEQFSKLLPIYNEWNNQINVISRKDTENFYERHVLHSLGIAKIQKFENGSDILDIGTGGGFPGIPLAILYPNCNFLLVDSIGKKIKVVQEVAKALNLTNVTAIHERAEKIDQQFDFIVSRAVAQMETFVRWNKGKIAKKQNHDLKNGILYLKGGDLSEELKLYTSATIYNLPDFFEEDFFETKKVVHLGMKYKG